MAAVVLPTPNVPVSSPFHMAPPQQITSNISPLPAGPSSSRSPQPASSSNISSTSAGTPEPSSKTFKRIRSSLEQSLRTATRSRTKPLPPTVDDEFGTITPNTGKGKEKQTSEDVTKEKEKSRMLKRLESKVTFRRSGKESLSPAPSPVPPINVGKADDAHEKVRMAGFTSYITPSLRQASMSSPAIHLSSQALPSPKSRSAIPASSSSSTSEVLVSPHRDGTRRSSVQPTVREISAPILLAPKRDTRRSGDIDLNSQRISREPSRHRSTKSTPPILTSPSTPSLPLTPRSPSFRLPPSPHTPQASSRPARDTPSPPDTPTPMSKSRSQLVRSSSRGPAASSGHLPLTPTTPRASSPTTTRSSSTRPRVVSPTRGLTSASASHLPLSSSPSLAPRRPSIDAPRRPSIDSPRRPSVDSPPRRPSIDTSGRPPDSPGSRNASPSPISPIRPRAVSPSQRAYSTNRVFNISTTSLASPSNPEHRELIRTATTMLCKELVKPPPHLKRSESGLKEWEGVEVRAQALMRLERVWGKSGAMGSSANVNAIASTSSSGFSAAGEERERRLFCDTLKDGFVLCQLMNKLRSASVVRPDPRDDGVIRTSNVTKFLAACASYGLPQGDLFLRDDLIEGTGESLARVAHTIIALLKFVDAPITDRSKYLSGQGNPSSPYGHGAASRAAASTPNLQRSTSPTSSSPVVARKRWSPPVDLPTVRSNSPDESSGGSSSGKTAQGDEGPDDLRPLDLPVVAPRIMTPPPRSPLRAKSQKREDDGVGLFTWAVDYMSPGRSTARPAEADGDPTRDSVAESSARQSIASSAITDTTTYSSLLEVRRRTSSNRFGTIRTMTTEATSDAPSFTRTEGSSVAASLAEDLAWKRGQEAAKHSRERRVSETPAVDLSRVIEETEESGSSSQAKRRDKSKAKPAERREEAERLDKAPAIFLGKGKWPDDFIDAMQSQSQSRPVPLKSLSSDQDAFPTTSGTSPPRKLAIVRRNESLESLPQFPRRPTHRARHSIDTPTLLPKEPLNRDSSPDGAAPPRVMLRRNSTKPSGPHRNGIYIPRNSMDDPRNSSEGDSLVPFPRTASGERPSPNSSSDGRTGDDAFADNPRPPRGRFQSDIEGASSRRRARPNSYDELGVKPRSRFESMVNLGVGSGSASASDLMSRESLDGSAVRETLIIREEGKPPTHFQLGNCIGRGQFGSVYRALNLNTGQMVAVKRIRLEGLKEEEVTQLMREVDLVKSLSHPSIVKYEGMARDKNTLSIVLEFAENGSLGQTLKAFGKLNERLVASYVVKILEGLHYLHQSDVVHCDLKAANILTTKNGNVKLSDFGVSLNLRAMEREIKDVAGTPNWMAPEVIELKGASTKSDIWSLACTVIELLTGKPPYAEVANSMSVMFRIVEDDCPQIPEGCSPLLEDFLVLCFNKDPTKRPSAEILCEHPWLKKNWGLHKELRPQDSIPFLRRVSADLQKSEAVRYLSQIEMPDSPTSESPRTDDVISGSPPGKRVSASSRAPESDPISPREHTFVKTTFSKPMVCRVCLLTVKKSAVLCSQCSLIAHSKCATNAPPTCDLRSQLLLYAQYAEKGNPSSVYSNPSDILNYAVPSSPASDVPYVSHTPRTSIDAPQPPSPLPAASTPHPPTAFKFMAAFKRSRSRSSLTPEPGQAASSSPMPIAIPRGDREKAIRPQRPQSLSSTSTNANTSSLRSAATAAESFSSRNGTGTRSVVSPPDSRFSAAAESDGVRSSRMNSVSEASTSHDPEATPTSMPGEMFDTRRQQKREKDPKGCVMQ